MAQKKPKTDAHPPLRLAWLRPGELPENPHNYRTHPSEQLTAPAYLLPEAGRAGAAAQGGGTSAGAGAGSLPRRLPLRASTRTAVGDGVGASDGACVQVRTPPPPYHVKVEPRSNNAIAAGLSSFPGDELKQKKL